MHFCVSRIDLWSQNGSFQTPQSSQFLKRSLFRIHTYGHEFWETTDTVLSQGQAAEMGFSGRVHGMTLRENVPDCNISKSLNVEPLPRIERPQLRWCSAMCPECLRTDRWDKCYLMLSRESGPEVEKDHVAWLHLWPLTWHLWPGLVPSRGGARRTIWECCWPWGIPSRGLCHCVGCLLLQHEKRSIKLTYSSTILVAKATTQARSHASWGIRGQFTPKFFVPSEFRCFKKHLF